VILREAEKGISVMRTQIETGLTYNQERPRDLVVVMLKPITEVKEYPRNND
jgi:hypothetical protein